MHIILKYLMSKKIQIEYCAENGLGGSALKLKKTVQEAFPDVPIDYKEADGATNRIDVSWHHEEGKNLVWSNSKADTEKNHPTIVENLKHAQ